MYLPVYEPGTQKLLFKYDPDRRMIEIQKRNVKHVIDLTQYEDPPSVLPPPNWNKHNETRTR